MPGRAGQEDGGGGCGAWSGAGKAALGGATERGDCRAVPSEAVGEGGQSEGERGVGGGVGRATPAHSAAARARAGQVLAPRGPRGRVRGGSPGTHLLNL